ncbi:DUF1795 domain-containing protein [Flavobacteriaceae bacterium Ap0902]|nr:DUF1795 domain-containing protein [Flavobacteriaceae bacterium Ap0902]
MKNLYLIIFSLFLISCHHKETTEQSSTLTQPDYQIEYPSNWRMDESGKLGTIFILINESDSVQSDFNQNINLVRQDLPKETPDLEIFVKSSENQIKDLKNSKILNSVETQLNDKNAHVVEYNAELSGELLHYIQYYVVEGTQVLILTYTGKPNNYTNQEEILNILNSFKYE